MSAGTVGLPAENFWSKHNRNFAIKNGGSADVAPTLSLKNAQDEIVMGWTPNSGDLFAHDWIVVPEEENQSCNCSGCNSDKKSQPRLAGISIVEIDGDDMPEDLEDRITEALRQAFGG